VRSVAARRSDRSRAGPPAPFPVLVNGIGRKRLHRFVPPPGALRADDIDPPAGGKVRSRSSPPRPRRSSPASPGPGRCL